MRRALPKSPDRYDHGCRPAVRESDTSLNTRVVRAALVISLSFAAVIHLPFDWNTSSFVAQEEIQCDPRQVGIQRGNQESFDMLKGILFRLISRRHLRPGTKDGQREYEDENYSPHDSLIRHRSTASFSTAITA